MKKNIALVAGGDSPEYQISINSAKEIASVLNPEKYNVYTVIIRKGKWIVKQKEELSLQKHKKRAEFWYVLEGNPSFVVGNKTNKYKTK